MYIRDKYILHWKGLGKSIANRDFGPNGLQCHCRRYDVMFGSAACYLYCMIMVSVQYVYYVMY